MFSRRGNSRRRISTVIGISRPAKGGCWGLRPRQPVGNTPFVAGDRLGNLPSCIKPELQSMKLVTKREALLPSILELIKKRAQDENKRSSKAKTLREEIVHARGYRVLSDLYNDLGGMDVVD